MINYLNEGLITEKWSKLVEDSFDKLNLEITPYKRKWISQLVENQVTFEQKTKTNFSLNEAFSGYGINVHPNIPGMGAINAPNSNGNSFTSFYNPSNDGSADKFSQLLPVAIMVAAKTIGLELVPVIPMNSTAGQLVYMDFVYNSANVGRLTSNSLNKPMFIELNAVHSTFYDTVAPVVGTVYWGHSGNTATRYSVKLIYVGRSRVNGYPIFRVVQNPDNTAVMKISADSGSTWTLTTDANASIANVFDGAAFIVSDSGDEPNDADISTAGRGVTGNAQLVNAIENNIYGYSGAGANDTNVMAGPYRDGKRASGPMSRQTGEVKAPNNLMLQTYSKFVEVGTITSGAIALQEQITDLQNLHGIDVMSLLTDAVVDRLSQDINDQILNRLFALGWQNAYNIKASMNYDCMLNLDTSDTTGSTVAYLGSQHDTNLLSIAYPPYISLTGATYENFPSLANRIAYKIHMAAGLIRHRTMGSPANFVVCNQQIANVLEFTQNSPIVPINSNLSNKDLVYKGKLNDLDVYVDLGMGYDDGRILVGRKGKDEEPGLKFMPYVMAEKYEFINTATVSPQIQVKSRYALVDAGKYPETAYYTLYVKLVNGKVLGF